MIYSEWKSHKPLLKMYSFIEQTQRVNAESPNCLPLFTNSNKKPSSQEIKQILRE